ncbi:MAG: adenosylcobinamide-GDP ribazoletransferase [Candidatus Altarchaeum sp.]|nr:adenosylcobinamide-GDP ribazoletransferase [Candidatus Altarchaeum sp.]
MNSIMNEIKKFLCAIQFLTTINLKFIEWDEQLTAKSVAYFPAVGILIGCILTIAYFILSLVFPNTITAVMLIVIEIIFIRGMHLDGFIDTVDGLFGGMNKEERLRIMKDTHPGSFGIIAVVLLILLKFTLIFGILNLNMDKFFIAEILILMPALGRYAMLIPMAIFPYARDNGTAHWTKFVKKREILTATLFVLLSAILIAFVFHLKALVLSLILLSTLIIGAIVFSLMLSKYIVSKIGGMTGDTYGAINEISEVIVLLLFLSFGNLSLCVFY